MPGGVHPPLSVIGSWPQPNYRNPETEGNRLTITTIVLGVIAILVVAARLYARIVLLGNPGWDDFLIVLALVRVQRYIHSSQEKQLTNCRFRPPALES